MGWSKYAGVKETKALRWTFDEFYSSKQFPKDGEISRYLLKYISGQGESTEGKMLNWKE